MALFRCDILPLRIENGRFRNEAPDERFCTVLDDGSFEDGKHFLLSCKAYDNVIHLFFESVNLIALLLIIKHLLICWHFIKDTLPNISINFLFVKGSNFFTSINLTLLIQILGIKFNVTYPIQGPTGRV